MVQFRLSYQQGVFRLERKWIGRQEHRFAAKSNWTRRKFGRSENIVPLINSFTAIYFFSLGCFFPLFEVKIPATSFPGSLTPQAIQDRESLGLSVKRFPISWRRQMFCDIHTGTPHLQLVTLSCPRTWCTLFSPRFSSHRTPLKCDKYRPRPTQRCRVQEHGGTLEVRESRCYLGQAFWRPSGDLSTFRITEK